MKPGIYPVGHRILVLPDEVEKTTKSGIIMATHSQHRREEMAQTEGLVVAIGSTAYADQKTPWCEVGDRVIFARYVGTERLGADGRTYRIISDLDVVAVVEKTDE